jgi:hypothetical protein
MILLNVCAYCLSLVLYLGEEVFCVQVRKTVAVFQTGQLMLYREITAVYSEIHTKHINALCGQNVEMLSVKLAVHIVTTELWNIKFLRTITSEQVENIKLNGTQADCTAKTNSSSEC